MISSGGSGEATENSSPVQKKRISLTLKYNFTGSFQHNSNSFHAFHNFIKRNLQFLTTTEILKTLFKIERKTIRF